MNIPEGYRSTHLNRIEHDEASGRIKKVHADYQGVDQIKCFDPYQEVTGSTIGWSKGVSTEQYLDSDETSAEMSASDSNVISAKLTSNSWIAMSNVDFGRDGARTFKAIMLNQGTEGVLKLRLDRADGPLIGEMIVPSANGSLHWVELTTEITGAQGEHDLYIMFEGSTDRSTILLREWNFNRKNEV